MYSKSNSTKQLEYDNVDHTTASPTKKADMQFTEDAALIGEITSNYFGDITNIQNQSKSDTKKTLSSEERVIIKIAIIEKIVTMNNQLKEETLFHCSSAVEKKS